MSLKRRAHIITVVAIFTIMLVALLVVIIVAAIFTGPNLERALGYVFDRYPAYEGILLKVRNEEIYEIDIGNDSHLPAEFFVLIGDKPKRIQDLKSQDMLDLGFEPGEIPGVYFYNWPPPRTDMASFSGAEFNLMSIQTDVIRFSASPEGPFLALPVSMDQFEEQFGKPTKYVHRKSNWHDPR